MRPVRSLLEFLGLVRPPEETAARYRETDKVIVDARSEAAESRRLRLLEEHESFRKRPVPPQ
jgi:hypothetical protein